MSVDKIVALVVACAAAVLPVLVADHVVSGTVADVLGALVGAFTVGYHTPAGKQVRRKTN